MAAQRSLLMFMRLGVLFQLIVGVGLWTGHLYAMVNVHQEGLLPGDLHWIVRVLNLIIGLASVPIAEGLVPRVVRAPA